MKTETNLLKIILLQTAVLTAHCNDPEALNNTFVVSEKVSQQLADGSRFSGGTAWFPTLILTQEV